LFFPAFAMNPSDAHSSLAALRQLKEMLDAGTITPTEFETLKRQIVFGQEPALPLKPAAPEEPANSVPTTQPPLAAYETPATYSPVEEKVDESPAPPLGQPADTEWLAAPAPSLLPDSYTDPAPAPEEERRNPLNLVFALGGLLVFIGVIAYLMLGRPSTPNEHLTSASQTAADSTAVVPEVGPQAEQLNLPPAAAPETIRVAPVTQPLPASAASQFRTDSVAAPKAPPATKASAAEPTAGTTVVTDSSSTTQPPK
jgi:hypothetical protein